MISARRQIKRFTRETWRKYYQVLHGTPWKDVSPRRSHRDDFIIRTFRAALKQLHIDNENAPFKEKK